ncbi:MAG TPA: response regulator [Acidimicrobiales bacterium]|nr:response regulator [Acidimicrobiales bacterium]
MRLLVVDDCSDMRYLLRLVLSQEGHEVTDSCSGAGAVEMAAAELPDVVILDGFGPGMDGSEAVRRIRQASPGCRVVMFSAVDPDVLNARAEAAGAVGAVNKLSGPGAVIDLLERLAV